MPRPWRRSGPPLSPAAAPGRSYQDGEIRPAPRPGRRRPGLRHARRAAAGLRGRRPALGRRGAGRRRPRPPPDSGVEDRSGGRGVIPGTGCCRSPTAIRPEEAVIDAVTPVFNLHPDTIRRRLQQAARAAGLPGWRDITGHSGWVGMAQDLSAAGFALPELMTAASGSLPGCRPGTRSVRQPDGGRWPGTTRAAGGRGPASQPRETGASEVVAVFGSST